MDRRVFLRTAATGTMGVAAWSLLGRPPAASAASAGRGGPAARTLPFNGGWRFGPASSGSTQPGFNDSSFATVTLPHTVAPLSWQDWDPSTWENVWSYRKHFDAPDGFTASGTASRLEAPRVFLDFAAVLTRTTVTLNGTQVADHYGGYLPFSTEITNHLKAAGNVLALTVDSTFGLNVPPDRPGQASSSVDFWQPGGVYRDVRLRAVPQVYVSDVFARPVNVLDSASRAVKIQATVDAAAVPASNVTLTVVLADTAAGGTLSTVTVPVSIKLTGETTVDATLSGLSGITLWDTENPKLYTVTATLNIGGQPFHDYQTRIGFREASFTSGGFYLNGVRTKLFGLNRHQLFPFAGMSMPDRVQAKDARILRSEFNCNIVRSHYPQSEAFFDAADELGLLVWEEIPGWGYLGDASWQHAAANDVRDMIVRDRNHPSIVIWGAMPNEAGAHDAQYAVYNDLAHSLDPSRPTGGDNTDSDSGYVFDVYSIHDYYSVTDSGGVRWPQLAAPTDLAGRPYLVSETVGTLSGPARYYRRTDTQFLQQGEAVAHAKVHNTSYGDNAYNGVVAWAAFDYPSGNGNEYQGTKYVGVADLFRIPKPGAAIYQAQVDPSSKPVIAPAFYWDFNPQSPVTSLSSAMIASNLDELKVYVGGSLLAAVTPDKGNYGNLPYPPSFVDFSQVDGSEKPGLRIDGYRGGVLAASKSFSADPSGDKLSLEADDVTIDADGTDATRVAFRAVDAFGNPRPYVDGEVTLDVSGPGALVGDNPLDIGPTGGVGAVWIRSLPGSPGVIRVRASHRALGTAVVKVTSQAVANSPSPVPYGSLAVSASPALVTPGKSTVVTAKLTNNGLPALTGVTFEAIVPDAWSASGRDSASVASVPPATSATASWTITVPKGADPGRDQVLVRVVYHGAGQRGVTQGGTSVVSSYASLSAAFDNKGISDDSDVSAANFDGAGNSYSAQALAAAGLAPGATVTHDQITFTWPDTQPGQPDNVVAQGQTILLSGTGTTLGILGAGSPGSESGDGTVYYTDGTSSRFSVTLDGFFRPSGGSDTIATLSYCNDSNAATAGNNGQPGKRAQSVGVFYTSAPLTAGKTVQAVTLPPGGSAPASGKVTGLHIFALAIGPLDSRGQPIGL